MAILKARLRANKLAARSAATRDVYISFLAWARRRKSGARWENGTEWILSIYILRKFASNFLPYYFILPCANLRIIADITLCHFFVV